MKKRIGFIGLGSMGIEMAGHLVKRFAQPMGDAEHQLPAQGFVCIYNRTYKKMQPLRDMGASRCATPAAVAELCDVILTSVSDDAALNDVVFGPQGLIHKIRPGSVLIDTSTVHPETAQMVAAELAERQAEFLDAPVTGGVTAARSGTLVSLVGGKAEVLESVKEILGAYSLTIKHCGAIGEGLTMKVVNQTPAILNTLAAAETIRAAMALNLDLAQVIDVVNQGYGRSNAFADLAPRMAADDMMSGFKAALMLKDLRILQRLLAARGCTLRWVPLAVELLENIVDYLNANMATQGLLETCMVRLSKL